MNIIELTSIVILLLLLLLLLLQRLLLLHDAPNILLLLGLPLDDTQKKLSVGNVDWEASDHRAQNV
jgi:hypothetical protein